MTYRLRSGEDARFELEDGAITLASRGGSRKQNNAVNADYGKVLRKLLDRIFSAGIVLSDAYVDSAPVQSLSIRDRRIIDPANVPRDVSELFMTMSRRMERVGQLGKPKPGNSTKRIRLELSGDVSKNRLIEVLDAVPVDTRSADRIPAKELRKVTPENLWLAREELLETKSYAPFDDSDEYDVLLEDGRRLPPKALLGKALSKTLGYQILPKHFTGGATSTCFSILREHGYQIVAKGAILAAPPLPPDDREWPEGDKKGRWHLQSERRSGLAEVKRQEFIATHGKLFCERCNLDPLAVYGSEYGAACIEVHHAHVAVADMRPGHKTKLTDLQCLCANCHRIEHKRMRALADLSQR